MPAKKNQNQISTQNQSQSQSQNQSQNQTHSRTKLCFISLVILFVIIFYSLRFNPHFTFRDSRLLFKTGLRNFSPNKSDSSPLLILIWPNDATTWGGVKALFKANDSRCKFTDDIRFVNRADVLLHYFFYAPEQLPKLEKLNNKTQVQSQLRIFFMAESPIIYNSKNADLIWIKSFLPKEFTSNSYHWTFTYRQDSDIVASYGSFKPLPNTTPFSPEEIQRLKNHSMEIPKDKLEQYKKSYLPETKTKLVGWIVSHCPTQSKREELVRKLSEFVPVDVYGKCGNLSCPPKENCYKTLGSQYKFYLSFENALCLDYVTEKFFRVLKNDMIPIVYGGISGDSESEYEKVAPPGSYINVRDFSSVEELANYMKFLDENPQEYLKYFLWKEKYWIHEDFPWWDICDKVYPISKVSEEGRRIIPRNYTRRAKVKDVASWWFKGRKNKEKEKGDQPVCKEPPSFI